MTSARARAPLEEAGKAVPPIGWASTGSSVVPVAAQVLRLRLGEATHVAAALPRYTFHTRQG